MIEKMMIHGTERLYYTDSHMKEFTARVVSCEPEGKFFLLQLDRTAFFPEGGGQFGDVGWINDVPVRDTREKDGIIYHCVEEAIAPGSEVKGRLDWDIRFDRMQQHSAEHIVSGLVNRYFGYDNVGFHLGNDATTLDFNGEVSTEWLERIENEANTAVAENLPFQISFPTKEEEAGMTYRSKIEIQGQVRIVTVPGYDVCACCAPHVYRTGEIGLIRISDAIRYKGGVRVTILCGMRALRDYRKKDESSRQLGQMFSVPADRVTEAVRKLKQEAETRRESILHLQDRLIRRHQGGPGETVLIFEPEIDNNIARTYVDTLARAGVRMAAVFLGTDETGYRYILASRNENMQEPAKRLNQAFAGRGGGKPDMVQGSLSGKEAEIRALLDGTDRSL